ncbi:MAG: hypothetical protein KA732_20320 [Providencia sp.]|uniref:hypothetical protein n=1 Tax=Providencia sp. TaxID=589 RepID=UPI001B3ECBC1|nr:hypothetical protein [Providencia sp.]MBP6083596.1 hypothetical protein [Providencia sp.]
MTSIIVKISEAINASRSDPNVIITETLQSDNSGKLFVSGIMSVYALSKWDDVYRDQVDWISFHFIDDYDDAISPVEAIAGEKNSVTILFHNNIFSPYFFTIEGWKLFLFNDDAVTNITGIHLAFIATGFKTLSYEVLPWAETTAPQQGGQPDYKNNSTARSLVKYFSSNFLPTAKLAAWLLDSSIPENNSSFDAWKVISCREVLKCIPNELFVNSFQMVGLSGKPSKKIQFGYIEPTENDFKLIQLVAKWIYFEGDDIELKHTFLSNELAREWQDGVDFCEGIKTKLAPALDSARLLYKAHIRSSSKETLKALGDLRKNLADDMQKIIQQSKDLTSSLWKDVALVISTIVIKYTLDTAKMPNASKTYAVVFFAIAVFILISHFVTIIINSNFIKVIEENRMSWRKKLYGYLDDADYNELATQPIQKAYGNYKLVRNISSCLVVSLAIILCILGLAEFVDIKEILSRSFLSITAQINIIADQLLSL